jgi:hypothetical protein
MGSFLRRFDHFYNLALRQRFKSSAISNQILPNFWGIYNDKSKFWKKIGSFFIQPAGRNLLVSLR